MSFLAQPQLSFNLKSRNILQFLSLIQAEIKSVFPDCSQVVSVFDVSHPIFSEPLFFHPEARAVMSAPPLHSLNLTEITYSKSFPKYSRLCSLIAYDITALLMDVNEKEEEDEEDNEGSHEWPQIHYPGSPHRDFHVFFIADSVAEAAILKFAKSTQKIKHNLFAIYGEDSIEIFTTLVSVDELIYIATWTPSDLNSSTVISALKTRVQKPNFDGWPIVINVCARCGDALELYEEERVWYSLTEATVNIFVFSVNATPEFEKVITLPRNGRNEEGEWDDWISPLIDGSAAISTLQKYNAEASREVLYTEPNVYDVTCFITAKPKRMVSKRLSKMTMPLSFGVWLGSIVSLVALFIIIEASIHFHRHQFMLAAGRRFHFGFFKSASMTEAAMMSQLFLPPHLHRLTISALIKPMFDQAGIGANFDKNIAEELVGKFLLGTWYLMLIVLGCGYKSIFTSLVVLPEYTKPPVTFAELANSHFSPYAIVWRDNLEDSFVALGTQYSKKLVDTVREYNYFDVDCFHSIFKGDNACIGPQGIFNTLAIFILVDAYGQPLYIQSKESLFPQAVTYAVSKRIITAIDKFNWIIKNVESSGLGQKWSDNQRRRNIREGRKRALKFMKEFSIFDGKHEAEDDEEGSIVLLLTSVLQGGYVVGTACFVLEIIAAGLKPLIAKLKFIWQRYLSTDRTDNFIM